MRNKDLETKIQTLVKEIKESDLYSIDLMESAKYLINEAILCSGTPDRLMASVLIDECWKAIGERD